MTWFLLAGQLGRLVADEGFERAEAGGGKVEARVARKTEGGGHGAEASPQGGRQAGGGGNVEVRVEDRAARRRHWRIDTPKRARKQSAA